MFRRRPCRQCCHRNETPASRRSTLGDGEFPRFARFAAADTDRHPMSIFQGFRQLARFRDFRGLPSLRSPIPLSAFCCLTHGERCTLDFPAFPALATTIRELFCARIGDDLPKLEVASRGVEFTTFPLFPLPLVDKHRARPMTEVLAEEPRHFRHLGYFGTAIIVSSDVHSLRALRISAFPAFSASTGCTSCPRRERLAAMRLLFPHRRGIPGK